jgi:TonB family protein
MANFFNDNEEIETTPYHGLQLGPKGLKYSAALHVGLAIFLFFGLPDLDRFRDRPETMVVEILPISAITNVKPKPKKEIEKKTEEEIQEKKPINKAQKPPTPQKKQPKQTKQDKTAEKIKQKVKPEESIKKKQSKKETAQQKAKKGRDAEEVKNPPQKDNAPSDEFAKSILKTLDSSAEEKNNKQFDDLVKAIEASTMKSYNPDEEMSLDLKDAIKSQIEKHWNLTAFSGSNSKGLIVVLSITMDIEGEVTNVEVVKAPNHTLSQTYVEAAIRAVRAASPLQNLPKDQYQVWHSIEYAFDPSESFY